MWNVQLQKLIVERGHVMEEDLVNLRTSSKGFS